MIPLHIDNQSKVHLFLVDKYFQVKRWNKYSIPIFIKFSPNFIGTKIYLFTDIDNKNKLIHFRISTLIMILFSLH